MEEIKFKKGDRVRVIKHSYNVEEVPVGSIGTVLDDSSMPYVEMDDETLRSDDPDSGYIDQSWVFFQEELELLESEASNA